MVDYLCPISVLSVHWNKYKYKISVLSFESFHYSLASLPCETIPDKFVRRRIKLGGWFTVKKFYEVVQHQHLVTPDQFSLVSKKDSGIPKDNFNINIKVFRQIFTNVELLHYKHIPNVELFRWWQSNLLKFLQMSNFFNKGWMSQNWRHRGANLRATIVNPLLYHRATVT